ncbi:hypothetical protein CLAIMM_07451, partial [Cladophialophora immunda]
MMPFQSAQVRKSGFWHGCLICSGRPTRLAEFVVITREVQSCLQIALRQQLIRPYRGAVETNVFGRWFAQDHALVLIWVVVPSPSLMFGKGVAYYVPGPSVAGRRSLLKGRSKRRRSPAEAAGLEMILSFSTAWYLHKLYWRCNMRRSRSTAGKLGRLLEVLAFRAS